MNNDSNTNISELKTVIKDFCEARDWGQFHDPKDLAIGAITEASELLEHFRFLKPDQIDKVMQDPQSRQEIGEELADVLFFVLRFAQQNDFDLSQCFADKMQKNAKKYPADQFKGKNNKSHRTFIDS